MSANAETIRPGISWNATRAASVLMVVVIAVFAGLEYAFVAIPSQTALQEELPSEVRGRIFGILNTLLSLASFAPVIAAPAVADVLNIFFPGAGIPVVMGLLGVLTLLAGIASWRRNARSGLHERQEARPLGPAAAQLRQRAGRVAVALLEQPVHHQGVGDLLRGLGGEERGAVRLPRPVGLEELPRQLDLPGEVLLGEQGRAGEEQQGRRAQGTPW